MARWNPLCERKNKRKKVQRKEKHQLKQVGIDRIEARGTREAGVPSREFLD
jgi:hypothetical protein